MPTPINTAADLRPWRGRLAWTQARAATELRIHLVSYKRLEACRAEASGTLLRLAELLELHAAADIRAPPPTHPVVSVLAPDPNLLPAPSPAPAAPAASTRSPIAFGGPFGRIRRPAPSSTAKSAPTMPAPAPAPVPTPPTPSDADLALEDALEIFDIPEVGRPLILAEIERQRLSRFGSRSEGGPTDRQLREEAEDREHEWRSATGDTRELAMLAKLVAEAAELG